MNGKILFVHMRNKMFKDLIEHIVKLSFQPQIKKVKIVDRARRMIKFDLQIKKHLNNIEDKEREDEMQLL